METPTNKDAPVRRRRKISRTAVHREVTPEGSKVGRRRAAAAASSEEEEEESAVSSSANNSTVQSQMSRNNSTKSATLSAHKSKILSRRDKAIANQRSQSQPRIELSPPPPPAVEKEKKSTDLFHFIKVARRSLSSPRHKDGSRNASPNPSSNGGRSPGRSPAPSPAPNERQKESLEAQQLSKLELNLQKFEEERRRFEIERRRFETERRELDRIRLKRLEERDKKRIAEGYQQLLLAKRAANEESRKASLKAVSGDPEENQRLIESFNKAQESSISGGGGGGGSGGERRPKKSSAATTTTAKKKLQPPDLVPVNPLVRRSVSLRRRVSPRHRNSTSEDADDEYGTERKSSDSNSMRPPTTKAPPTESQTGEEKRASPTVEGVKKERGNWFTRIFKKKPKEELKKKEEKIKKEKKIAKGTTISKWKLFKQHNCEEMVQIKQMTKRCIADTIILAILCGLGGLLFRFSEGALENFYKCGAKKVKRDFLDLLWDKSHNMREDDWKSLARNKLRTFEEELQAAFDSGMNNYSGQNAWSFLNSCIFSFSVITTIGYGHIAPATTAGRSITILYSVIGIPIFLIVLADFGKLFTRCIKFVWAYVRGLYYTGSCRKVRKTVPMQDMVKGMNIAYDFMRRPSTFMTGPGDDEDEDLEKQETSPASMGHHLEVPDDQTTPQTPMPSEIEIDDEFNLPISLALFILISYILLGAALYSMWESWTFFESFYFVFISMSTIGFGDYVPNHPIFMMCSIVYLVFGLALTSMCINVVQLKLSDSFRQASSKIRETIGLADGGSSINDMSPCPDLKSEGNSAAIAETPKVVDRK